MPKKHKPPSKCINYNSQFTQIHELVSYGTLVFHNFTQVVPHMVARVVNFTVASIKHIIVIIFTSP